MKAQSKYEVESPVQIVTFETNESTDRSRFILNTEVLCEILNPHKDRKIVVVSVAGAYREGKSFLLNIFLRYLQLASTGNSPKKGWLKRGGPLQGFESRSSTEGVTKGIWAWPDLFVFTLDDDSEVAVMLVDYQGAFDNHANPEECAMVFTFSMLMSSVQIYNVSKRIQRDNLENLQLFIEYGKLAAEDQGEENGAKPFQKLVICVRDFQNPNEFAYGQEGGEKYLLKELNSDGQSPQLKNVKKCVRDTFEELKCYLNPHPGDSVAQGHSNCMSTDLFDARNKHVTDMKQEFAEHAERLSESLLHPDVLVPKRVAGKEITGWQLIGLLVRYAKVLENGKRIDANTILQIKANFCNNELVNELYTKYKDLMTECLENDPWVSARSEHDAVKATVLKEFDEAKKLGGDVMAAKHREELEENIEKTFAEVRKILSMERDRLVAKQHSELLRTYNSSMEKFMKAAPANVPIDPNHLSQKHQQYRKSAVEPLENRVQQYRSGTLDYDLGPACEQLNRDIQATYNNFVNQNNLRTEKIQATKAAEDSKKKRLEAERAAKQAEKEKGYVEAKLKEERERARQEEQRQKDDLKAQNEKFKEITKQNNKEFNRRMAAKEAEVDEIRQEQRKMKDAAERQKMKRAFGIMLVDSLVNSLVD